MISKNIVLLDQEKLQNVDLMDQSQANLMTKTQQSDYLTRSKSFDVNTHKTTNINQALTKFVQKNRPGVQQQTANFAEQVENSQMNMGIAGDPILAMYDQYKALKWCRLLDSGLFNDVGSELKSYKKMSDKGNLDDQKKLNSIKTLRAAVQKYLDAREKEDGTHKSTQHGRRRLIFMRNLIDTLMQQECLLEFSKWGSNGGAKENDATKEKLTKELSDLDEEYKKAKADRKTLVGQATEGGKVEINKIKAGAFKLLSDKIAYLEYRIKKLNKISKNGKISTKELCDLSTKYYDKRYSLNTLQDLINHNVQKGQEKNEAHVAAEYMYDREKKNQSARYIKNAYQYLDKEKYSKSYDENFDLEVMNKAKGALKTAKIGEQAQNSHTLLTDFLHTTKLQINPLNMPTNPTQSKAVQTGSNNFETIDEKSIGQLDCIKGVIEQRNVTVDQFKLLAQVAKDNGANNECKSLLNHACKKMENVAKVTLTLKDANIYRNSNMDYTDAMWDLKDAYLLADGELKDAIAVLLYGIEKSSRGNLDVKGKNINTHHDWEFSDSKEDGIIKFEKSFAPLFDHEPVVSDIMQGALGDCFLLAEMTTIVRTNPNIIKDAMLDEGDTVAVRFYNGSEEKIIRVDKTVARTRYMDKGHDQDYFAMGHLWVQMLEKAFVAYKCSRDYDIVSGSTEANNLTKLLVKGADYDEHYLSSDQNQSVEQRMFIYDQVFDSYYDGIQVNKNLSMYDNNNGNLGDMLIKMEYRSDKHAQAMDIFRAASKRLSDKQKINKSSQLDSQDLKKIAEKSTFEQPTNADEKKIRKVENAAYEDMIEKIGNKLHSKEMDFSEIDLETLRKQFEIAKAALLEEIKQKTGNFYQSQYSKKLGSNWLEKRVEEAFKLVNDYIEATINTKKADNGTTWNDYSKKENADFELIKTAVHDKKFILLDGAQKFSLKHVTGDGMKAGIYAGHEYCILDTQEIETSYGYTKKMVLIKNPHGRNTATYQEDKKEGMIRNSNTTQTNAGLFWLDIRDIESTFKSFHISKSEKKTA